MTRRKSAVEATRRRIVEATVALHTEKGVRATRMEDVATRAGVALATVYRHFPELDLLVAACGQRIHEITEPPTWGDAERWFRGVSTVEERISRLVRSLFDYYERAAPYLDISLRERDPPLPMAERITRRGAARRAIVAETLHPARLDQEAMTVALALVDYPLYKSLREAGVGRPRAEAIVVRLLGDYVAERKASRDRPSQQGRDGTQEK